MIASLHQAPLAKIGFVVKDAPKLDIPDDVLLGYILAAALPLFAVGFWIYSGAAARAEGVGGAADYGVSGIYKVDGKIPTNPAAWKIQSEALQARGIKDGMTGEELVSLFKKGKVIIVDVRGSDKFARGGIKGSVNVQMFRRIEGWTPLKAARRFQFALFGQVGTEFNPNFLEEFETKVPKNTQVVFVDDSSMGTLKPSQAFPNGKCSHALMAAYLTGVNGYERTKMQFLEGGIDLYARAGGEIDGTIEPPFMRT
jgi:rhodanese-related sulfurtransferase